MRICIIDTSERLDDHVIDYLMTFVAPEKAEKLKKFWRWQDRQLSLCGDLLSRKMLSQLTGIRNSDLIFEVSEFGKPKLGNLSGIHFNISHAGKWVVCVLHSEEVGIDIEHVEPIDLAISESFFHRKENEDIQGANNSIERFFDYWTLKESFIKFIGKGLSQPLNSFLIQFENDQVTVELGSKIISDCYLKQYPIDLPYKLAVCAIGNDFSETYETSSINEIMEFLDQS